jgi:hypothetical protein
LSGESNAVARQESVREQPELVVPTPMQQDAAVSPKRAAKLAGLRVLVIEDESLIPLDLVDTLKGAGAQPTRAVGPSVQIAARGRDVAVAERRLNLGQAGAAVDCMRAVSMPKPMRRYCLIDAGRLRRAFHHAVDDALDSVRTVGMTQPVR